MSRKDVMRSLFVIPQDKKVSSDKHETVPAIRTLGRGHVSDLFCLFAESEHYRVKWCVDLVSSTIMQ